jgi:hypothetical protein
VALASRPEPTEHDARFKEQAMWNKAVIQVLAVMLLSGVAALAQAEEGHGLGLQVRGAASAADTGLPAYPGARMAPAEQSEDGRHSGDSVNMSLWAGLFGFKLAVAKFESSDDVESVARFYRSALERMGPVLDCSPGTPAAQAARSGKGSRSDKDSLNCDDNEAEAGGRLYKVGSQRNQHIVNIEPMGRGSSFELVAVQIKGWR